MFRLKDNPHLQTSELLARQHARELSGADLTGPRRGEWLELIRNFLANGRDSLHQEHLKGASGRYVVHGHAHLMDNMLQFLHHLVAAGTTGGPPREGFSLVATGGYGRRELSPYSDVDLLFLIPDAMQPELGQQVELILYFLWDLRLDLGHAVRTIGECVEQARREVEIRTALLESRFLAGNHPLFERYRVTLFDEVLLHDPESFLRAKLMEQRKRHERFGNTLFYLEPNIKENPGGQRDIHTFFWISKYRYRVEFVRELIPMGLITEAEYRTFTRCREFFWRVRNALHYRAGRREDRLTFNHQLELAAEFGYRDRPGMRGVEQFMRRYYQVAKQVHHLSQIFLQKYSDEHTSSNRCRHLEDVFWLVGDKVMVIRQEAFREEPSRLMRLFEVGQRNNKNIHPETMRLASQYLGLVNRDFRRIPAINEIFLQMLNGKSAVGWVLRKMNAIGLLGRFLPEFGRIIGQSQYDLYHVYTVDEHSIKAVETLRSIMQGKFGQELPLTIQLMKQLRHPELLYLAVLLHDVAKGRGGEHELKGAVIAQQVCTRLGLASQEVELVAWLVRNHLLFSRTAFRRDINDPSTVTNFAKQVGDQKHLDLLLLLTEADIRAVGPGVWNQWKATLLQRLYFFTLETLNRGMFQVEEIYRLADTQKATIQRLLSQSQDPALVAAYLDRFYADYFINYDPETLAEHYLAIAPVLHDPLAVVFHPSPASGTTEMLIHTPDHPGLIAKISGALASQGVNILAANVNTTKDGMIMDVFVIQDSQDQAVENPDKLARIHQAVESVLSGRVRVEQLLTGSTPLAGKKSVFEVPLEVDVDNDFSDNFTVMEVSALDRMGLLFRITREFERHGVQIRSAKIATYGERAVDVFYLKDLFGLKLDGRKTAQLTQAIREALQMTDVR